MKRISPADLDESPVLICAADRRLRNLPDSATVHLQRSIKANCILGGSVTLPSSLILSDGELSNAINGLGELLKHGLLLPDLRLGIQSFKELVEHSTVSSDRPVAERLEIAGFLDSQTKRAISYSASDTSKCYVTNLLRMLFYRRLNNQCEVSWRSFREIVEEILNVPVVGTTQIQQIRRRLKRGRRVFDTDCDLIYHMVGAAVTGSSPLLPEAFNQPLQSLITYLNTSATSRAKTMEAGDYSRNEDCRTIAKLLNQIEEPDMISNTSDRAAAGHFAFVELLESFSIEDSILDHLDDQAIVEIAKSGEAKRVRHLIAKTYESALKKGLEFHILKIATRDIKEIIEDFRANLRAELRSESRNSKRLSAITSKIGWTGVAVGMATFPLSGTAALAMSISGVLLSAGGSSIGAWNQLYTKPMLALIEKIESKAISRNAN